MRKKISQLLTDFNNDLARKVDEIATANPDVKIILFDSAQTLKNLMDNRGPHGEPNFNYGLDLRVNFGALSVDGMPDIRIGKKCYRGTYLGSKDKADVCRNPHQMIFWDEVHPTSKGHCTIAYSIHLELYQQGWIASKPMWTRYRDLCR